MWKEAAVADPRNTLPLSRHIEPPTAQEDKPNNAAYDQIVRHLVGIRQKHGILDMQGQLDASKKLEASAYEIFTREYYKIAIHEQQGIPEAGYQTDEELREYCIMKTQQLIQKILETQPDVIFLLDKSARPVSWLLHAMWPLFVDQTKHKLPPRKFINVDANAVLGKAPDAARPTDEEVLTFKPSAESIKALRGLYEKDGKPVHQHPDSFGRALVIDEVMVSGASLAIAENIISAAFPGLEVSGTCWMSADLQIVGRRSRHSSQALVSSQLPPWYNKHFSAGRGIEDPITIPFRGVRQSFCPDTGRPIDPITEALRTDIQVMASDIMAGRQSVRPFIGCYEVDPNTGEEIFTRAKYKLARFDPNGMRVITLPYASAA